MCHVALDEGDCVEYVVDFRADCIEDLKGIICQQCSKEETTAASLVGISEVVGGATFSFHNRVDVVII